MLNNQIMDLVQFVNLFLSGKKGGYTSLLKFGQVPFMCVTNEILDYDHG